MNSSKKPFFFSSLYWKISAIFIIVLALFAGISIHVFMSSAYKYSLEVAQKLNWDLARNMADLIRPRFDDGTVNKEAVTDMVHSMMVINPSIEIYLLDPQGKILTHVAPAKKVMLSSISLEPIKRFLDDPAHNLIYGDDPRNPDEKKTFSATDVYNNGRLAGYIYIVLAGQKYVSSAQMLSGSYILGFSVRSVVIALIVAAFVGLFLIWFITNKLKKIVGAIRRFESGDFDARIPVRSRDELDQIGLVFNQMAEKISKNIQQLKDTDEFRKELISNVSHDLRTPIASIQGYAETLKLKEDQITPAERMKYLDTIYVGCERLKKLVVDLFDLSKLETNQTPLRDEPFPIAELIFDVADKYRIISERRNIHINTFLPNENPIVQADILLIDRVLQNLIDNAIRFSKENGVINIRVRNVDARQVEISVTDSGEGIRPDELPYIFERYYKGKQYGETTGLGLAIVKKIIELHGSQITVESRYGEGAAFTFRLPLATS